MIVIVVHWIKKLMRLLCYKVTTCSSSHQGCDSLSDCSPGAASRLLHVAAGLLQSKV